MIRPSWGGLIINVRKFRSQVLDTIPAMVLISLNECVTLLHTVLAPLESYMARVQLVMPDADRDRFVHQAQQEGMSLSAWLRAAARERLEARQRVKVFESPDDVKEFFRSCAALDGPETEPDWDEHLRIMNESRGTRVTGT